MNKTVYLIVGIAIIAFGAGRYTAPSSPSLENVKSLDSEVYLELETLNANDNLRQSVPDHSDCIENSPSEVIDTDTRVIELQQQAKQLQAALAQQQEQAQSRYQILESKFNAAQVVLAAQGKKLETISEEEASSFLPKPFSDLLAKSSGTMVTTFKTLQEQPQDFDWAMLMQQQISDFFITHELSDQVNLQSVICKQTICEVRGFELQKDTFSQIASAMSAQPWWPFYSTHSSSSNSDDYGRYFYMIASKKP